MQAQRDAEELLPISNLALFGGGWSASSYGSITHEKDPVTIA